MVDLHGAANLTVVTGTIQELQVQDQNELLITHMVASSAHTYTLVSEFGVLHMHPQDEIVAATLVVRNLESLRLMPLVRQCM